MGLHPRAGKFPPGVICHPAAIMRDRNKDGFGDLDAGFWGAGRLTTGAGGEGGALLNITVAYDLTREAQYEDGTPVYTDEMRRQVTEDLILAGCGDMENYDAINNKCGPGRALSGAVGILFGHPQRVRRALNGFEELMGRCFHFDGFCTESPAYSSMHLGLMEKIPDIVAGYTDPPDYEPEDGPHLENLDPFAAIPRYGLALQGMARMLRPDLLYPVIGDTHAGGRTSAHYLEILVAHYGQEYVGLLEALQGAPVDKQGSEYALWNRDPNLASPGDKPDLGLRTEYFPGWQVGVLRSGNDASRTAFYFNGYSMHGHRHNDTLGIIYHAFDRELASDRGYIWDDPRNAWTRSTLSHNLVTVDGADQKSRDRHSSLEFFGTAPGVEVIQASANAYEQCSEYRRTCALIRLPGGGNYVADVFRVTGGKTHQYCFNGNGDFVELSGPTVAPIEGKLSWLTNLRADAQPPDNWHATWRDTDVSMRLFMAGELGRLLMTDAPGWRSNRGSQLNAPPITELLAERTADADLASVFTAVISPYEGETCPVKSVQRLEDETGQAVCVVVELDGRTDYIISSLDDEAHAFGPVQASGRFAMVSLDARGALTQAYLMNGTELTCGETRLSPDVPRITRQVVSVDGSTVELDEPLPDGRALEGSYLLTGRTGFEIEKAEGATLTVRAYPFVGGDEITIPSALWLAPQG